MHPTNGEQQPKQNQTTKPSEPLKTNEKEGEESSRGLLMFPTPSLSCSPSIYPFETTQWHRGLHNPRWSFIVVALPDRTREPQAKTNSPCVSLLFTCPLYSIKHKDEERRGEGRRESREVVNTTFLGSFVHAFMSPGVPQWWRRFNKKEK